MCVRVCVWLSLLCFATQPACLAACSRIEQHRACGVCNSRHCLHENKACSHVCVPCLHCRGTYEAYAASPRWSNPTLALALNSGVGQQEEDSWANALQVLLDKDIPTCFTCYQQTEAACESASCNQPCTCRCRCSAYDPFRRAVSWCPCVVPKAAP